MMPSAPPAASSTAASPIPPVTVRPSPRTLTERQGEIVTAAGRVLEDEGPDAVTMRRLATEIGIKAPSIYKHLAGKADVLGLLVEEALFTMGEAGHEAVDDLSPGPAIGPLLVTYRRVATSRPHHYRLVTGPAYDRSRLVAGLEDWAGESFFRATGEPHLAQALWSFAHGMVILEIDERFQHPDGLALTWTAGATAFASAVTTSPQQAG